MSIILRHKRYAFMVIYKDSKESWDDAVKDRIIEEIKEDGFDKFSVIDVEKAQLWLGFRPVKEETNKKKEVSDESR
jgi:hypothetical protein